MLDTIPLKKRKAQKALSGNKNAHTNSGGNISSGGLSNQTKLKPWILVLLILIVTITGIVVYRSTQASSSTVGSVPGDITDIQNYIDSLVIVTPSTKNINVSNYAQFSYTPKTSGAVSLVAYYIDGKMYVTSTKAPYSISIDTTRIDNGDHEITAVAFNDDDVPIAAVRKTISVNNNVDILRSANNIVTYPWNWLFRL